MCQMRGIRYEVGGGQILLGDQLIAIITNQGRVTFLNIITFLDRFAVALFFSLIKKVTIT